MKRGPLSFHRPALYDDYYIARHSVDDNNNLRQSHYGIEAAWESRSWSHRQLAFLVALAETNAWQAKNFFFPSADVPNHLDFRKAIIVEAFKATGMRESTRKASAPKRKTLGHVLQVIPKVGKFRGGSWDSNVHVKSAARQWRCSGAGCHSKTRHVCSCNPYKGLCKVCYGIHVSIVLS